MLPFRVFNPPLFIVGYGIIPVRVIMVGELIPSVSELVIMNNLWVIKLLLRVGR